MTGIATPHPPGGECQPRWVAFEIAALLTSGLCGQPLVRILHEQFPDAQRAEVYLAYGIALADLHAEIVILELELAEARRGGADGR